MVDTLRTHSNMSTDADRWVDILHSNAADCESVFAAMAHVGLSALPGISGSVPIGDQAARNRIALLGVLHPGNVSECEVRYANL